MAGEEVRYNKTPTEVFLSAAKDELSIEEAILMEMERNGNNRNYANSCLSKYLEKGYIESYNGRLKITDNGLEELKHPGKRGRKPNHISNTPKSREELYGSNYPFYQKQEEDILNYWGQPILFQGEFQDSGEKIHYHRMSDPRGDELYMQIEGSKMPVMVMNKRGAWKWSFLPMILLALQYKGGGTVSDIENTLEIKNASGKNMSWVLNKLAENRLISGPKHRWGRYDNADESATVSVSPKGEMLLKGLYDSLYEDGGSFLDLLYEKPQHHCKELSEATEGSIIPSVNWLVWDAKSFFETNYPLQPKNLEVPKDSGLQTLPNCSSSEGNIPEVISEPTYPENTLPSEEPNTEPVKYNNPPREKTSAATLNIPKKNIIISRNSDGSTKSYLKVNDEGDVVYIDRKKGKEYPTVLIQNGALTSSGLALQEMAQTGKTDYDLNSLIRSGLVSKYWPERYGEETGERYNRKAQKRRKNEKRQLYATTQSKEILELISQE